MAGFTNHLTSTFVQKFAPPDPCAGNDDCIKGVGKVPLLKNMRTKLIDPDTPDSAKSVTSTDGKTLNLVVCVHLGDSFAANTDSDLSFPMSFRRPAEAFSMATIRTGPRLIFGMA